MGPEQRETGRGEVDEARGLEPTVDTLDTEGEIVLSINRPEDPSL